MFVHWIALSISFNFHLKAMFHVVTPCSNSQLSAIEVFFRGVMSDKPSGSSNQRIALRPCNSIIYIPQKLNAISLSHLKKGLFSPEGFVFIEYKSFGQDIHISVCILQLMLFAFIVFLRDVLLYSWLLIHPSCYVLINVLRWNFVMSWKKLMSWQIL